MALGPPRPLRATSAGDAVTVRHPPLYVATAGSTPAARHRDANADDRLLVAYPVGGSSRRGLLRETARNAATGHRRTLDDAPFLAVDELWLETDRPAGVEVDGELHGGTPVRVGLAANALRVMAPPESPDR